MDRQSADPTLATQGKLVSPHTPDAKPPLPPTLVPVSGYEVLRELGRGGMGVVYQARHLALNRVVALKMILAGAHAAPEDLARFRTEATALARFQHPNIVQVHEVGEAGGLPYFALEYVDGGSLADRLAASPLPPADAARLVQTLALAVHAAHERGVVHRDLKPANVLLTSEGTPKVTDFGLAKVVDQGPGRTQSGAIVGTPSYMSPEQASGQGREVGPATDVYALGALLYECLTGRPPFRAASSWETIVQVVKEEPVPPAQLQAGIPPDLDTICLKCLDKDPRRRYASAAALADDVGRFLRHEPIRARPGGLLYRSGKFARRHKGLVASVSALLLALTGGIIGTSIGLVRARASRDRARAAEQEVSEWLAVSHYDAARLALRVGEWRKALQHINVALTAGFPDTAALRLDQVRAWCALHDIPQATRAVDALARRTDLGALEGPVLLWQADLALNRPMPNRQAALNQVRKALDLGLPPAEAAYARGLLARTSPEAVDHLQRAVREDPFNARTSAMLAMLLTSLGRHQEAQERLRVAELLFPEDPTFRLIHAQLLALKEDRAGALAQLELARPQLGVKQMATARALTDLTGLVPRVGRLLEGTLANDPGASLLGTVWQVLPLLSRLEGAAKDPEGDLYLPLPPVLKTVLAELPLRVSLTNLGLGSGDLSGRLGRLVELHPEGLLFLGQGVLAARQDTPEAWAAAEKAFVRAAETPSILPIHQTALFAATAAEWVLSREGPALGRAGMKRRAATNLRKVVALGVRPAQAESLTQFALDTGDLSLAQWVVGEWERQTPHASGLAEKKTWVAFRTSAYAQAAELADRLVHDRPREAARWQKLRDEAVRRLREQASAVNPKSKKES